LKNPTDAVLFRLVDATKGALGLDEVEKLYIDPKGNANQIALLDGGYKKGVDLYRVDMDQHGALVNYDGFGLKAFTHVGGAPGSLYNRSIVIVMFDNQGRKKISLYRPAPETFKEIRAQLYSYRLRYSTIVKATYEGLLTDETLGIYGRTAELFLPLLTIAKLIDEDLFKRILEYARKDSAIKDQMKQDPVVQMLVSILQDEVGTGEKVISDIRTKLNEKLTDGGLLKDEKLLSSQRVMGILGNLGFKPVIDERGKPKRSHNRAVYLIDPEVLAKNVVIYLSDEDKTEPKKPKIPPQTKLDVENKKEETTPIKLPKLPEVNQNGGDVDADSKSVSADKGNLGEVGEVCGVGHESLIPEPKTPFLRVKVPCPSCGDTAEGDAYPRDDMATVMCDKCSRTHIVRKNLTGDWVTVNNHGGRGA
jgi:hypothetical protein